VKFFTEAIATFIKRCQGNILQCSYIYFQAY